MTTLSKQQALAEIDRAAKSAIMVKYYAAKGLGKDKELERWAGIIIDCCAANGILFTLTPGPIVDPNDIGNAVEDVLSLRADSKDYKDWRGLTNDPKKWADAVTDTAAVLRQMEKNGVYVRKGA